MKHKGIRITLVVIELFVGLWAVIGGVGLVTGAIPFLQMPIEYLQGTPFSDYTIPGLLLLLVVGGSFLLAAATILTGREVGVLASALAGLIVIGFEVVEVPIIDRYANTLATAVPQQIIMTVLGLACFGLATYLWLTEYRSHSFLTRQKQETTAFRRCVTYCGDELESPKLVEFHKQAPVAMNSCKSQVASGQCAWLF